MKPSLARRIALLLVLLLPSPCFGWGKDGQLGQAYFERCIPVVNRRLAMAGVRLAELLNRIFTDGAGH